MSMPLRFVVTLRKPYLFFGSQKLRGHGPRLVLAHQLRIMPLWHAVHPRRILLCLNLLLMQLVVLLLFLHHLCLLPIMHTHTDIC